VLSHYGLRTLLYGILLPGPHIGKKAGHVMRRAVQEGHEVGIHCHDHVLWQDHVASKDANWTRLEMQKAHTAFTAAVRTEPQTIGAAGWQLNRYVIELEEEFGFAYASDVRGYAPFFPTMQGSRSNCMQLPTTLPTLDEIIGSDDINASNCWQVIFNRSLVSLPAGHVYTLHAELEGMKLIHVMEKLIEHWIDSKTQLITLGQLHSSLDKHAVPAQAISWGEVMGRSGTLAIQAI